MSEQKNKRGIIEQIDTDFQGLKITIINPFADDPEQDKFPEQLCGWNHDPDIDCSTCLLKRYRDEDF